MGGNSSSSPPPQRTPQQQEVIARLYNTNPTAQHYAPHDRRGHPAVGAEIGSESLQQVKLEGFLFKDTVRLERVEDSFEFNLLFSFTAVSECTVSLFFFAEEREGDRFCVDPVKFPAPQFFTFFPSVKQTFQVKFIDFHKVEAKYWDFRDRKTFPLTIQISPTHRVHSQISYFFLKREGNSYVLKPLRQRVVVEGRSSEMMELYGMAHRESEANECVVCLVDPKDTVMLPCKHVCICRVCAERMRTQSAAQCPICRAHVESFTQFSINAS